MRSGQLRLELTDSGPADDGGRDDERLTVGELPDDVGDVEIDESPRIGRSASTLPSPTLSLQP